MASPTITVECAFASDPGAASPSWTDISAYVMGFRIKRGRQTELDRIDAGGCTVELNNTSRRFDPTYASSPYYPNVLPMRKLRIKATHNAVAYTLFVGYVQAWPQVWPGPTHSLATVTAIDGFLPLSKTDVGAGETWPEETSGARIGRVLDEAGWPAADRSIDTGYSYIEETIIDIDSGVTALEHIGQVADAELGVFFIDHAGNAVFHDRHHRRAASYLTAAATFGDSGSELAYTDLVPEYTVDRIWNDVRVSVGSGFAQSEDATSQTAYLRRTLTRSVPLARETEAEDQADYLLSIYKDPAYRLTGMTVKPATDSHWPQMLGREIGDHLAVKRRPPPSGSATITQESAVESIEHQVSRSASEWVTVWTLSTPAFSAVDWWLLGDATYGVLDSTTKLVY